MNLPVLHSLNPSLALQADQCLRSWLAERCQSEGSRLSYIKDLSQFGAYLKEIGRDPLALTRDDVVKAITYNRRSIYNDPVNLRRFFCRQC